MHVNHSIPARFLMWLSVKFKYFLSIFQMMMMMMMKRKEIKRLPRLLSRCPPLL